MATASENKEIVAGAYAALAGGDVKGFLAILDPDIQVSEPACLPYGGTYSGTKEVLGMFAKAGPVVDGGRTVVEHLVADGDRVVALLTVPLRSGGGEASISEHWQLRDGKAVRLDVFWADPTIAMAPVA